MAMAVNNRRSSTQCWKAWDDRPNNVVGYNTLTYSDDLTPIEYNVEKAKALMAEAGYPKVFAMTVTLNGDTRNAWRRCCRLSSPSWALS
jgi:ABC-type transport system substrate-binding protein